MSDTSGALRRAAALAALLLAFLALPVALATTLAAPAQAVDTCPPLDLADPAAVTARAAEVENVFLGRVDDVVVTRSGAGENRVRTLRHQVTVTDPMVGDLAERDQVEVVFSPSEAGDERRLVEGERYLFFTTAGVTAQRGDYCTGVVAATGLTAADIEAVDEALNPPVEVVFTAPSGGSPGEPDLGRLVAPGAAIGLVGLLGLFLVSRLARSRS